MAAFRAAEAAPGSRVEALGAEGTAWLERLPALLAEIANRWQLELGRGLPSGSTGYSNQQ